MNRKEYQGILEYYIDSEARNFSEKYLEKYWLTNIEMLNPWIPIKNRIFCLNAIDFPDLMFRKDFELITQRGGITFSKEEYYALQKCMKVAGDNYFVLIENRLATRREENLPYLRFKFPVVTTWEQLNNGDENFPDIAFETLFVMNKHFFIFGDSGKWGKYTASNYVNTPLDIIGFIPELASIFREQFLQLKEEQDEIREWLPEKYKVLIKW